MNDIATPVLRDTAPARNAQDAARAAAYAARQARLDGHDETYCAQVYSDTYAAEINA